MVCISNSPHFTVKNSIRWHSTEILRALLLDARARDLLEGLPGRLAGRGLAARLGRGHGLADLREVRAHADDESHEDGGGPPPHRFP